MIIDQQYTNALAMITQMTAEREKLIEINKSLQKQVQEANTVSSQRLKHIRELKKELGQEEVDDGTQGNGPEDTQPEDGTDAGGASTK